MKKIVALSGFVLIVVSALQGQSALRLPGMFSEGMVLQRDVPVPVWGWGEEGDSVSVKLLDRDRELAYAGSIVKNGKWKVELNALPAGGRYTMVVADKEHPYDDIIFSNIMVGDVWIVCGQSNAMMTIRQAGETEKTLAEMHNYPNIRHAHMARRDPQDVIDPQDDVRSYYGTVKWEDAEFAASRRTTEIPWGMTAVGYYFARELVKFTDKKVPVGILELSSINRVESWVDDATIAESSFLLDYRHKPYPHATSRCYNANVAPLAPYPVKGVIYYQGEMNAGDAALYGNGLEGLIKSWRKAWNNPEMPFLIVQLPAFIEHKAGTDERLDMDEESLAIFNSEKKRRGFVLIREAQRQVCLNTSNTELAVILDLGEQYDIHPQRKREVGERLFLLAQKHVYGDTSIVSTGPTPEKMEVKRDKVIISYSNTGSGIVVNDGNAVTGFELCVNGEDFVKAEASIEGSTITVSAKGLKRPVAVRYAFANFPIFNVYNREGFPAVPFIQTFK